MAIKAWAACASCVVSVVGPAALAQVRSAESYREEIHAELRRLHGVEELRADALREAIERADTILETPIVPAFGNIPFRIEGISDALDARTLSPTTKGEALVRHAVDELERQGVFDLVDQAARAKAFVDGERWPPVIDGRIGEDYSEIRAAKSLALGLRAAVYVANIDGDVDRRDAMIRRALTLAESRDAYGTPVSRLVSNTLISSLLAEVRFGLSDRPHTDVELQWLLRTISNIELSPLSVCLRLGVLHSVAMSDDGSNSAKELNWLRETADPLVREAEELAALRPSERPPQASLDELFLHDEWSVYDINTADRRQLASLIELDEIARLEVDATRIAIALELHRMEHGVYPETLDPLAPLFGGEVPRDAWSWAPFDYEVTDNDAVGGYLLRTARKSGRDFGIIRKPYDAGAGAEE